MLHTEEKLTALCWQGCGKGLALLRRCPTGQGRAGAPAKLKADRGAEWSNEEPKGCPVPQECNSPLPPHTQAPRPNPVGLSPPGKDLLSLPLVFPNGECRIIWAQPTHSSPFVQSPEQPNLSIPLFPQGTAAVPVCSPLHRERGTR